MERALTTLFQLLVFGEYSQCYECGRVEQGLVNAINAEPVLVWHS
jgi:hypothetical protein